jgi:hypothetical protein
MLLTRKNIRKARGKRDRLLTFSKGFLQSQEDWNQEHPNNAAIQIL